MTAVNLLRLAWPLALLPSASLACTTTRGDIFESRSSAAGASSDADCPDAIYCTGFEDPPPGLETIGTGSAEVVAIPVRSGSGALRASTAAPNDWARLALELPALSQLGVRLWAMLDANASNFGASEVHVLLALHPAPELAVGGANKVSIDIERDYQLKLVETITPDKKHSQSPLVPGSWHCLQLEVAGEPGAEQAALSMDGTLRAVTQTNPAVVSPGGFQSLLLGIEYSTGATPITVYFDDVEVAASAPPCEP